MAIDRERLTKDIAAAARVSFSQLLARHGEEAFYAFALYTDEDCWTVLPAANSLEQFRAKADAEDTTDPQQLAAERWSTAEWAYECFAAEPFDAICERLRDHSGALPDEPSEFSKFKAVVHQAMIAALKGLDDSGFFAKHRDRAVLFITSSDDDEAEALEDGSAKLLNPPEIYEAFRRRYEVET